VCGRIIEEAVVDYFKPFSGYLHAETEKNKPRPE
jgi:hypothetical protein